MPRRPTPPSQPLEEEPYDGPPYSDDDAPEEEFDAPPEGEGWDGEGGPPEGQEEAYAASAPPLPPTPSKVKSAAKEVLDRMQGVQPMPASVVAQRSVVVTAKRTISTKDRNGTLDARAYEVTLSQEGQLSYEETRRITAVLANDVTAVVAGYLDAATYEDAKGRLLWAAVEPTVVTTTVTNDPGGPGVGAIGALVGAGALGPPAAPAPAPTLNTQTRPLPYSPVPTTGEGSNGGDSNYYPKNLSAVLWEDYAYSTGKSGYFENFINDATGLPQAHPNIRPRNIGVVRAAMVAAGLPINEEITLKRVYISNAPPTVRDQLASRGVKDTFKPR